MIQRTKRTIVPIAIGFLGAIGLFQTLSITVETGREAVSLFSLCDISHKLSYRL